MVRIMLAEGLVLGVLGSALALTVAVGIGYRLTLFVGVAVYLVAWAVVSTVRRSRAGTMDECRPE